MDLGTRAAVTAPDSSISMTNITYSANVGSVLRNLAAGTLSVLSLWLGTGTSVLGQLPPPEVSQPALTIDPARFQLERHGPVDPTFQPDRHGPGNLNQDTRDRFGGFPQWYQDKTGLALELGTAQVQAEIANAWLLVGPDTMDALGEYYQFPVAGTFTDEHFYFHAATTGTFPIPAGVDLKNGSTTTDILVELGHEAAYGSGLTEEWGTQWVFTRQRIVVRIAPYSGSYKLETPYKNYRLDGQIAGQRIFFTDDVGVGQMPAGYANSLTGDFGPYLVPADAPGGDELAPFEPAEGLGRKYLADPGVQHFVTGSPIGQNFVRLSWWNGAAWQQLWFSDRFSLSGRIKQGEIPSRVTIEEAIRHDHIDPAQRRVDVFAKGEPYLPTRLPAAPYANRTTAKVDLFLGTAAEVPNLTALPMQANQEPGICYYLPALVGNGAFPTVVTARDGGGFMTSKAVTDGLFITQATYFPDQRALQVSISSASGTEPATYELVGVDGVVAPGSVLNNGSITLNDLAAPPSFVTVKSSGGGRASANVVVVAGDAVVAPGNQAPTAIADSFGTAIEGEPAVFSVLVNDTDPDGDTLLVTSVTQPTGGSAQITDGGRTITFTAKPGSLPTQSFTYTISDLRGGQGQAEVSVTINAKPVAPTVNVFATVGVLGSVEVLNGVTDREQSVFEIVNVGAVVDSAGNPVASARFQTGLTSPTGQITVLASPDAPGQVTFPYTVSDLHGGLGTGSVVVIVNRHPIPANDAVIGYAGVPTVFNLLANDSDPDGDVLRLESVQPPAGAQVAFDSQSGQVTLLAETAGTYGFSYTVGDGRGGVASAFATVVVQIANLNPVAIDDVVSVVPNTVALVDVLLNDVDAQPLTISGVSRPALGEVTLSADLKRISYTPSAAAIGTVQHFNYSVTDGFGGSASAAVTLNVQPLAVDDSLTVVAEVATTINVLGNDVGPDLLISAVTAAARGSVTIAPDRRSLNFTADAGAVGVAQTFTYTVTAPGGAATGTVTAQVVDRVTFGATATYTARTRRWNLSGSASPGA